MADTGHAFLIYAIAFGNFWGEHLFFAQHRCVTHFYGNFLWQLFPGNILTIILDFTSNIFF